VQILDLEREIFALENQINDLISLSRMYDSVGDITPPSCRKNSGV
jgi:acetyl-CoA carboxylase carboxyl transferase subunit alpha